jgi:hypothetical protein
MKGKLTPEQEAEIAQMKKSGMTFGGIGEDGRIWYVMDEPLPLNKGVVKGRRTSQRERDQKRLQWELKEKQHAEIQADIERCEAEGTTYEEIMASFILIPAPLLSPAMQFIANRLDQSKSAHFDDDAKRALVDLVKSDIPLDRPMRQQIAGELQRLYFPNARERRERKQAKNQYIEQLKSHLIQDRGMTATEAEGAIVEHLGKVLGIKSVDLRPSRRK